MFRNDHFKRKWTKVTDEVCHFHDAVMICAGGIYLLLKDIKAQVCKNIFDIFHWKF